MKTRSLRLKRYAAPSIATATGPVFAMLDEPGVVDAHGDTMDAGALKLPPAGAGGVSEVPLYWVHSYHHGVVAEADPCDRVAIGVAMVWEESGQPYFTPRFFNNTPLSDETQKCLEAEEITDASVGYLTRKSTPNGKGPDGQGEDVHDARLIEVSLVDDGAKQGAVRIKTMTTPTTPPAPPKTATKALEQADVDTISALLDEKLKPVLEQLGKVLAMCEQMSAEEAAEPEAESEEVPAKAEPEPTSAPSEEMSAEAKAFARRFSVR